MHDAHCTARDCTEPAVTFKHFPSVAGYCTSTAA